MIFVLLLFLPMCRHRVPFSKLFSKFLPQEETIHAARYYGILKELKRATQRTRKAQMGEIKFLTDEAVKQEVLNWKEIAGEFF